MTLKNQVSFETCTRHHLAVNVSFCVFCRYAEVYQDNLGAVEGASIGTLKKNIFKFYVVVKTADTVEHFQLIDQLQTDLNASFMGEPIVFRFVKHLLKVVAKLVQNYVMMVTAGCAARDQLLVTLLF
jgi:hypothetical protein